MSDKSIEVRILNHSFNGMPVFLAKLTQRGHEISNMNDLLHLYHENIHKVPSERMMTIPHTTLRRMCHLTVAIVGLSTKCVSQLRTHATRLTFVSTSTQYSAFDKRKDNFDDFGLQEMRSAFDKVESAYRELLEKGIDKDLASYVLPQGLKKSLVIDGNLADWQYVMQTRLCNRNSKETQEVMRLIYNEIYHYCGPEWVVGMLPKCCTKEGCQEGKMSCGRKFEL